MNDYLKRLKRVIPACEDVPQARGKVAELLTALAYQGTLMKSGSKYDVKAKDGKKIEVKGGTSSPNRHTGASAEWDFLVFVKTDIFGFPLLVAEIPRNEIRLQHDQAIQTYRDTMKNGIELCKKYSNPCKLEAFQKIYMEAR